MRTAEESKLIVPGHPDHAHACAKYADPGGDADRKAYADGIAERLRKRDAASLCSSNRPPSTACQGVRR